MNIQLNSVSPFGNNNSLGSSIAALDNPGSSASFQNELSAALTATLQKFGLDPNNVSITIGTGADSGAPGKARISHTPQIAATPFSAVNIPASTTPASTASVSTTPAATTPSGSPPPNAIGSGGTLTMEQIQPFDDAYWAKQPAPVQALRDIDDEDQRMQLAGQLARQGYAIDVPIMIWGWDPAKVTNLRMSYGYTWVPSALQPPVELAPGLPPVGTLLAYDPGNPTPGSILVRLPAAGQSA